MKKLIRSGSPTDISNKEDVSKKDQKSPLYLLKLLSHPSILTIRSYLQKAAIPEEGTGGDRLKKGKGTGLAGSFGKTRHQSASGAGVPRAG